MPVAIAGVDTLKSCWRVTGERDAAAIEAQATSRVARAAMLPEPVAGHRVMWYPGAELLAAEGHPNAAGGLARVDTLPEHVDGLAATLSAVLGVALDADSFVGVGRIDATVDLAFASSNEGLAALSGIAALDPGGTLAPSVRWSPGARRVCESVAWHTRRGVVARAYDKGRESGKAAVGELVRLEGQTRWQGLSRRTMDELTPERVAARWKRRFMPLWRASKGVRVVSQRPFADEVARRIDLGEITYAQGEQIIASQLLSAAGAHYPERTRRRRRALVREHGLVLADGILEETELNLDDIIEAAMDARW